MKPYLAYQKSQIQAEAATRIDLLLALYDGAIDRLMRAQAILETGNRTGALSHIARAQLIVVDLAAGVRTEVDEPMGTNMLRLYEFVCHRLVGAEAGGVNDAVRVLSTLRDGFRKVRDEAAEFERSGQLPSVDDNVLLTALG